MAIGNADAQGRGKNPFRIAASLAALARSEAASQAALAEAEAEVTAQVQEAGAKLHKAKEEVVAALDAAAAYRDGVKPTPHQLAQVEERMSKAAQVVAETEAFIRERMSVLARGGKGTAYAAAGAKVEAGRLLSTLVHQGVTARETLEGRMRSLRETTAQGEEEGMLL